MNFQFKFRTMVKNTLALCMLLSLVAGPALGDASTAEKESFIYKKVDGAALKILVSKPDDWKPDDRRPAAVFFHGGAWVTGNPGQFDKHCEHLNGRGMVCFQVQYRLMSKEERGLPPTKCVHDAKSALRWVRSRAEEFGIDPDRIASGGGSAGGHLAAFLGTMDGLDDPNDDVKVSARSNAMLLFNPVYNNGPNKRGLKGWGIGRIKDKYPSYSPAHNITSDDAPSIVFLGTRDKLIATGIAKDFQSRMRRAKVRSELHLYKGAGHGFFNYEVDGGKWYKLTIEETDKFLVSLGWLSAQSSGSSPAERLNNKSPSQSDGAFHTQKYRNLFTEQGYSKKQIKNKVDAVWDSLFVSTDDDKRVYYPSGKNANGPLAYIKDTGNEDVRSEGISYGMMIAVQMNKQAEFNALWNWAKTHMQHTTGVRKGYFAWQCSFDGKKLDDNSASDGEEYMAMALYFASGRWGNGDGIYNYRAEADKLLNTMLHKEDMNGGVVEEITNMFDRSQKQVVFVPIGKAATFTNPSYHLPCFYELWARWGAGYGDQQGSDRQFWLEAATTSRDFFTRAAHPKTGLMPDYSQFTGKPRAKKDGHGDFRFDAWRVASNVAVDYAWFGANSDAVTVCNRMQAFFEKEGLSSYGNQYSLSGNAISTSHSPGLVSMLAVASLAADEPRSKKFVDELWKLSPPTGKWRYYGGLLYHMAILHVSGNFRIYAPAPLSISDAPSRSE